MSARVDGYVEGFDERGDVVVVDEGVYEVRDEFSTERGPVVVLDVDGREVSVDPLELVYLSPFER